MPTVSPPIIQKSSALGPPKFPGFSCLKAAQPIHYPCRWHLDALVQASLDTTVRRMAAIDAVPDGADFAFLVETRAGTWLTLALAEADFPPPTGVVVWTRSMIQAEPRRTNARTLWDRRHVAISPGDRIRLMRHLSQHPDGLPLGELDKLILCPDYDPYDAVAALICEGALQANFEKPLTPELLVHRAPLDPDPALLPANDDTQPARFPDRPSLMPHSASAPDRFIRVKP
jgi:hypothetical protein